MAIALLQCKELAFFVFIFIFLILDKFVLKTWISMRVSYFVGILSGVRNLFLTGCSQVLRFRDIFEQHKSSVQKEKFSNK